MRIKKLPTLFIVLGVLVIGIIGLLVFLVQDIQRVWNTPETFQESSVISIPNAADAITADDEAVEGAVVYKVPYCLLYQTNVTDDAITYNCSYLPEYYTSLQKFNYPEIKFSSDVTLRVTKDAPLPTAFLARSGISRDTISSFGANPVPVSLEVTVTKETAEKNILSMIQHYVNWKFSQKTTPNTDTLVEWKVTALPTTLSDEQLKAWAAVALDDVNAIIGDEVIRTKSGQELINYFAGKFAKQTVYCEPYSYPCFALQEENAAPNILYYLYILQEKNDSLATKFITEAKNRVLPFVLEKNKDFKVNEKLCDSSDEDCMVDYQDMQAYQFPVCPVKQIIRGEFDHANVKLFMDFQKVYSVKDGQPYNKSKSSVITLLDSVASNRAEKMSETHALSPQDVITLNDLCYGMVVHKVNDAKSIENLKQTYVNMLSTRYALLEDGKASLVRPQKLEDFKKYVATAYYQPSESVIIPDEAEAHKEMLQGINSRSQAISEKKYIGSIALTLFLIYLYQ